MKSNLFGTKRVGVVGFTLIELLVVIAVIGILASVILASLNKAKDKGGVAKVQQTLANARVQADIYRVNFNTYRRNIGTNSSVCATNADSVQGINSIIQSANNVFNAGYAVSVFNGGNPAPGTAQSGTATGSKSICWVSGDGLKWIASVPLNNGTVTSWWCVDSAGTSKLQTTAISNVAPSFTCP